MNEIGCEIGNMHAPLRKRSIRSNNAPWLDNELRLSMLQRDKAKTVAQKTGKPEDRKTYCTLRNKVTKLNHSEKNGYFKQKMLCPVMLCLVSVLSLYSVSLCWSY